MRKSLHVTGVYRRTGAAAYELISANAQPTTNFADLAVAAGQTYHYVVTAVNSENLESSYSDEIQATIPIP